MPKDSPIQSEELILRRGQRPTPARVRVLDVLLRAGRPLTHSEIEERLGKRVSVNRVTVYRVLKWLTERGLAHRVADENQVWRYNAEGQNQEGGHAHFQCNRCGRIYCLEGIATIYALSLPIGYRSQRIELTIKGLCAECS